MIALAIALAVVIFTAVLIALFRRLASRFNAKEFTPEWLDNFSTANYAPMQRLFNEKDFDFLAAQPGYRPEIARQLRAERREVLDGYLQLLTHDFSKLHAVSKLMLVYSKEDQPDFGKALLWQQITFYYTVTTVRCRVALTRLGWTVPDMGKLIQPIEGMRLQLQQMALHSVDAAGLNGGTVRLRRK